ncbi:hypothetical protein Dimus_010242 [Dionaea muscipula]
MGSRSSVSPSPIGGYEVEPPVAQELRRSPASTRRPLIARTGIDTGIIPPPTWAYVVGNNPPPAHRACFIGRSVLALRESESRGQGIAPAGRMAKLGLILVARRSPYTPLAEGLAARATHRPQGQVNAFMAEPYMHDIYMVFKRVQLTLSSRPSFDLADATDIFRSSAPSQPHSIDLAQSTSFDRPFPTDLLRLLLPA